MTEHLVFLAFGSNLGEKQKNIEHAYLEIEKRIGKIVSKSAFHITEPDGFDSENQFVNSICSVKTTLSLYKLFEQIQEIEILLGRNQKSQNEVYSDRLIDIDILMYDDVIINTSEITVPHPRFHKRMFVLEPFAEIAPAVVHPVLNKTIAQLNKEYMSL